MYFPEINKLNMKVLKFTHHLTCLLHLPRRCKIYIITKFVWPAINTSVSLGPCCHWTVQTPVLWTVYNTTPRTLALPSQSAVRPGPWTLGRPSACQGHCWGWKLWKQLDHVIYWSLFLYNIFYSSFQEYTVVLSIFIKFLWISLLNQSKKIKY